MLAISVGPALTKHMHEMLDYMFAVGLTESLRSSLTDLSANIPPLLSTIQERLLDMLSVVLFSRSYVHPGAPGTTNLYPTLAIKEGENRDEVLIILALTTLGTFDFRGKSRGSRQFCKLVS